MLGRPAAVHRSAIPDVGDMLEVVTAFPPARGAARNLAFVDFEALRSVHGLVVEAGERWTGGRDRRRQGAHFALKAG